MYENQRQTEEEKKNLLSLKHGNVTSDLYEVNDVFNGQHPLA